MKMETRLNALRWALIIIGVAFMVGLYPLMVLWPAGFQWQPPQYEYEQMIVGIYFTLGIFLIMSAKHPMKHLSLIWFTVWSSVVHGGIMLVQALVDCEHEWVHLVGDVPLLFIIAIVLAILTPKGRLIKEYQAIDHD